MRVKNIRDHFWNFPFRTFLVTNGCSSTDTNPPANTTPDRVRQQ